MKTLGQNVREIMRGRTERVEDAGDVRGLDVRMAGRVPRRYPPL